jgi:glutaminyl-peptide cyclotransferase
MQKIRVGILALVLTIIFNACKFGNDNTSDVNVTDTSIKKGATFNADSAYTFIEKQVSFGPRVPGTAASKNCAAWLKLMLQQYCDSVYEQNAMVTMPRTNKQIPCINLIGEINPKAASRVLYLCHWDSRPYADNDSNKANHTKAIDAADDGASGVGVLLELARAIKMSKEKPDIGVDILFVDVEDMGKSNLEAEGQPSTYCLGSRYWASNPHRYGYRANFGICLDMVGAKAATFKLEGYSKMYAPDFQSKVWALASQLGHSNYFLNVDMNGGITDDHVEINTIARIPTIDVINTKDGPSTFDKHWHTLNDKINIIDKSTLKAVGETMMAVAYNY